MVVMEAEEGSGISLTRSIGKTLRMTIGMAGSMEGMGVTEANEKMDKHIIDDTTRTFLVAASIIPTTQS